MSKKQGKSSQGKSFEKSVIKDLEKSHLRIKPKVLEIIGIVFLGIGLLFIIFPLLSDRGSFNLPDFSGIRDSIVGIFNNESEENPQEATEDEEENTDEENEESTTDETNAEENADIDTGDSTNREDTATNPSGLSKATSNSSEIQATSIWRATDYVQGDISTGSYQVKLGDTLWEISEAVYGDGSKWHIIREDNVQSIDFLPDGSQALIYAGQFLTIR